ncbi:MAG: phage tail protein, partial [Eubacteriales bacterium]|nr:phage tail protein [Eubacteriales bacterium]
MMTSGEPHRLVLGTKTVGKLWVITDLDRALERFHKDGDLLEATVDIKMKEYEELAQMPIIANRLSFVDRMVSMPRVIPSPLPEVKKPIVQPTAKKVTMSATPVSKPTAKPASKPAASKGFAIVKADFVKADIAKNRSYNNTRTRASGVVIVKTRMTK